MSSYRIDGAMDHVAYMKKSWGLLPKILSDQKKIESRWYATKHVPWGKIAAGDKIYFKNSGEPVTAMATVEKVLQFEYLTSELVRELLEKYGIDDGIEESQMPYFYELFKNKKYCLLIFLKNPQGVERFEINKTGFGAMAAWITVENIKKIRK